MKNEVKHLCLDCPYKVEIKQREIGEHKLTVRMYCLQLHIQIYRYSLIIKCPRYMGTKWRNS